MNTTQLKFYDDKPTVTIKTASVWNELTRDEFCFVLKQHINFGIEEIEDDDEKTIAVEKWVKKCTAYFYQKKFPATMRNLMEAELIDLAKHHLFLVKECDMTTQLFPEIRLRKGLLFGPADGLTNCTFVEFLKANDYLLRFIKSKGKRPEYLNLFIAVLYRGGIENYQPGTESDTGDIRIKLNDNTIEPRSKLIERIPVYQKQAIRLWFSGCCKFLQTKFSEAFDGSKRMNEFGIHGIIDSLSGKKWGDPDKIRERMLYEMLIGICQADREIEQLKAEQNQ